MKTTIKLIVVLACMVCFLIPKSAHSQVTTPYKIKNNTSCSVAFQLNLLDAGCSNLCLSVGSFMVPAMSSSAIPTSGCGALCNVEVTIVSIDGGSGSWTGTGFVDSGNHSAGGNVSGTNCGLTGYTLSWSSSETDFNP